MRPSGRLRRRKALHRQASLNPRRALRRLTPLRRTAVSPASDAQRAKVAGDACLVCRKRPVDPAHLVPRSRGGCDEPECCVPLCRAHHRLYDRAELDLLPYVEPGYRAEVAHALTHIGLIAVLRRVTGTRWQPAGTNIGEIEERMNPMSEDPFSTVPEGMRCPHCNGYGSSPKEDAERCTHCGGSGLVMVADESEGDANGQGPGPLGPAA